MLMNMICISPTFNIATGNTIASNTTRHRSGLPDVCRRNQPLLIDFTDLWVNMGPPRIHRNHRHRSISHFLKHSTVRTTLRKRVSNILLVVHQMLSSMMRQWLIPTLGGQTQIHCRPGDRPGDRGYAVEMSLRVHCCAKPRG